MMFGSSLVLRRLLPFVSPRVLCVASNLLSECNDAINTIGCKQYRLKSGRFILPNANRASHRIEPAQGLLQFHTRCCNLTPIRSYGRPRFSPEHLTEAQIIDAVKSGEYPMDDVALWFSRKQLYKQKQFSPQFRRELGDLFVKHYSSLKNIDGKQMNWLLGALINLKYQTDPCFINLPLRSLQNGCGDRKLYNDFLQQVGLLPLLNWKRIPPTADLVSICQLIMPMISAADDRSLTYLLHTWCNKNGWREIAKEYLITNTFLEECQRRVPRIEAKGLVQLLEAISICLPLPFGTGLPPGWLEDVQKRLMSRDLSPSVGEAATLLDAFYQIQTACCPSQLQLNIPVAKRMFKVWFDPKQKCVGPNQTLTCLVLRAMGEVGVDPGDLDARFWPWLWREIDNLLNDERDDRRLMVLDALHQLRIAAPTKYVHKIINTVRADNPMLAAKLLYSLSRIKEHIPGLKIHENTKRSLTKGYIDSLADLPALYIVLGAWSFPKIGFNPTKADSKFWINFYKVLESCMTKLTSHQQTMLLFVLSQPCTEPPTAEWLSMFIAAIDSTPADSASGAALILRNLMLLHQHLDHPSRKPKNLLDILMENKEERILKFYKHWLKGINNLKSLDEHLFPLYAMNNFGLEGKVGKRDIERWCKCMEKYIGAKWKPEQRESLEKIIGVYRLPDCFRNKILKG